MTAPEGVAIDDATGRIYWADQGASKISFANLNGIGGGDVNTGQRTVATPSGVAIDPAAGKIYWSNQGAGAGLVRLPQRKRWGNLNTAGDASGNANSAALLEVPNAAGIPTVTGGSFAPAMLSCSQGAWANDILESLLYQRTAEFLFQLDQEWLPDRWRQPRPRSPRPRRGTYACQVTAKNFAGSTTQTSAGVNVAPTPPPASISVEASVSGAIATLKLTCNGVSIQSCAGSVTLTAHERKRHGGVVGVTARKRKGKEQHRRWSPWVPARTTFGPVRAPSSRSP